MVRLGSVWPVAGVAALGTGLVVAAMMPTGTIAQPDPPAPAPTQQAAPIKPAPDKASAERTPAKVQVPLDQALLLVRATLLTLNDANRSGNYGVLRDLASQDFQARNSSADLALVFAEMRRSNLTLFSVMLLSPQLAAAPEIDAEGRLRISGYVPTSPQQVKFDLVYESSSRQWKLLNINISTTPAQTAKAADQEQKPQARNPKAVSRQVVTPKVAPAKP